MLQTKIEKAFSQSAQRYDQWTVLHRQIADDLCSDIGSADGRSVLDVGCGTGYLAARIKNHFADAQVIGLDFSLNMLNVARAKHTGVAWVLGDAHQLPFADGTFDLVASNLAYQWSEDLSRAFGEARRVLSESGRLMATVFGWHTCQELFESLKEASCALHVSRLPSEAAVRAAIAISGFRHADVRVKCSKAKFSSMQELLGWLKLIGANHLRKEGFIGRHKLAQAADIYRRRFPHPPGVCATFEIISIYAQR